MVHIVCMYFCQHPVDIMNIIVMGHLNEIMDRLLGIDMGTIAIFYHLGRQVCLKKGIHVHES